MLILNCTWKGKGTRIANSEILKKKKVFADDPAGFLCAGRHGYYVVLFVSLKVYFFFFFWLLHMACGILAAGPGIKPRPLQRKHRVLTTGPPG